jgi:vancomycin resistance protein YoaR
VEERGLTMRVALVLAVAAIAVVCMTPSATPSNVVPEGAAELKLVSSFMTSYPCCPPRVTNIKRAATLLDGRTIAPGAVFSMNAALGKRTLGRGFVPAPMISGGRLVDSVGGGISQVATTLYNAAFFAGLALLEHTPHSFYISRYPIGREATISWGGPELIFRNDWSAPVRMRVTATDSAITVRFYSLPLGRRVASRTGRPSSYVSPRTIVVVNHGLAAGTRRLAQPAGGPGFTVAYSRAVYRLGQLRRNERFRVRYQPQNAIVEIGPNRSGQ